MLYSKTCLKWPLKIDKTNVLMENGFIVGILTFISMINTTSERLTRARNLFICGYFSFYGQLKFHAQLRMKKKDL